MIENLPKAMIKKGSLSQVLHRFGRLTPPNSNMRIISVIFQGAVITEGFGK